MSVRKLAIDLQLDAHRMDYGDVLPFAWRDKVLPLVGIERSEATGWRLGEFALLKTSDGYVLLHVPQANSGADPAYYASLVPIEAVHKALADEYVTKVDLYWSGESEGVAYSTLQEGLAMLARLYIHRIGTWKVLGVRV